MKYLDTLNPADCYGCSACEQICVHGALLMKPNDEGFLYPYLDASKCVNCGLCDKVCPIHTISYPIFPEQQVYAVKYKKRKILENSASGGMFMAVADYVLAQGGYVAGCIFDERFNALHVVSNSRSEILKMQGSKYVQSNTQNIYSQIRDLLKKGILVLFVGTPCQVAGLKGFLLKEYKSLITLDLICHGVPSPSILQTYLDSTYRRKASIIDLKFRNKQKNGWSEQGSVTRIQNKKIIERRISYSNDSYYQLFINNALSRYSCYSCKFSSPKRIGDITIGDYWNINDVLPSFKIEGGVSVAIINSSKGGKVFNSIKENLIYAETSLEDAMKGNANLSKPSSQNKLRQTIYSRIRKIGYLNVVKETCSFHYVIPMIKRCIPRKVKSCLRSIYKKIVHDN